MNGMEELKSISVVEEIPPQTMPTRNLHPVTEKMIEAINKSAGDILAFEFPDRKIAHARLSSLKTQEKKRNVRFDRACLRGGTIYVKTVKGGDWGLWRK
jgi:acetamidase/formamidase